MSTNPSQILEAVESFVCELEGERFIVHAGTTRLSASHKLATTYPQHFRPIEDGLSYAEDTTAEDEPGRVEGRARTVRTARSPEPTRG